MKRLQKWLPFVLGASLLAGLTLPAGRAPGGDAPHILAIAHRLAMELGGGALGAFSAHLDSLVTPHPPAGYLLPVGLTALGLGSAVPVATGLAALALCWHGMVLLRRDEHTALPLAGGLLLLASGMTWALVDRMAWDLLAAGCVVACLGHLHASNHLRCTHHAVAAGILAALGCLTKFTVPVFLLLPAIASAWAAARHRHWKGLGLAALAFAVVAGPWLSGHLDGVLAYVGSSADPVHTLSASPADAWASRLGWDNLSYTPRVFRDALGWPGLVLVLACVGGLAHPGARMAALAAAGGVVLLSFAGERQARYLFPALPLICLLVDTGLGTGLGRRARRWGRAALLAIALPMLWCAGATSWVHTDPPAVRNQEPQPLGSWAKWPWPAPAFRPTGLGLGRWSVDAAVDALAEVAPPGATVGIALPRRPGMPKASAYAWKAALAGHSWTWATVGRGAGGHPAVFLGPFPSEGTPRRFDFAYLIRGPRGQTTPLDGLPQTQIFSHRLPQGYTGIVIQVEEGAWDLPAAQRLIKDPMDP